MWPELLTGEFRDGPFVGLNYQTLSQKGLTDDKGKFFFQAGEVVTFSIGRLTIGAAVASPHLTLAALYSDGVVDSALTRPETVNRARFLQSLGQERDLRNGVLIDTTIRDTVSAHADGVVFASDIESFQNAAPVRAVFSKLGLRFRGAAEARNHVRRSMAGIRAFRDIRIPIRDGSYLLADVFRPIEAGTYPALLRMSIYGRAFRMGSIFSDADYDASEEREAAWFEKSRNEIQPYFRYSENGVSANASTWVPLGYVLVRVDSRGVGNTPGTLNPFSKQEALDYYDAIEWAAKEPWSDGNVGLYGGSYNATIQWNVAALHPPALKAIAPLAADADAYRDLAYPGGIFLEKYRQWWWNETVGSARNPKADAVDFISGLASHPWEDEHYHGDGILSAEFASIDIPVITAVSQTGWIHARAGFEAFSQLLSPLKQLLVLDAAYTSYMYEDCQPDLQAFFDRHLKGEEPAQEPSPVRLVMRTGDGGFDWRDAASWPIPGTEYRELFLEADDGDGLGRITGYLPGHNQATTYSADVQNSAQDLPMAVFESAPLDEDVELAGHFRATIWVASTSSDADVFVALRIMEGDREVPYPTRDPKSVAPLTWGCLKVSHRALNLELSTAERPWHTHQRADCLPLSPDDIVKVEVEMMAATGRIPAGRRLRVEISPAEGRGGLPGWERAYDESYHRQAINRIFTGGLHASSITIPVVPRQAS
ncbi:hypothetical protein B7463_g8808, partial [Scytalidium lignicola]